MAVRVVTLALFTTLLTASHATAADVQVDASPDYTGIRSDELLVSDEAIGATEPTGTQASGETTSVWLTDIRVKDLNPMLRNLAGFATFSMVLGAGLKGAHYWKETR